MYKELASLLLFSFFKFHSLDIEIPQLPITPPVTMSPTASPVSTLTLTPTPAPIPPKNPTPKIESNEKNGISDYLLSDVNEYRKSQGLTEVIGNPATCDFAKVRAKEISENFNHGGFIPPYPTYSKITENIAQNSDYKKVVPGWISSPGHAANMRADTPYVCIAQNGDYYAYEGLKP